MKNLCLENNKLSPLRFEDLNQIYGGRLGLWEGTIGRMLVFLEFTIGIIEGFVECNCE